MTLILDLTPEQERQIEDEARARNMDTRSYALAQLFREREEDSEDVLPAVGPMPPVNGTGADLVVYWEREGLIGTRPDIKDSQQHARQIRRQSERRTHSFGILR